MKALGQEGTTAELFQVTQHVSTPKLVALALLDQYAKGRSDERKRGQGITE